MSDAPSPDPADTPGYPPPEHMLRDLRLAVERGAGGIRGRLPVVPQVCADAGGVTAGVVATLVDVVGGECAIKAAAPDWVATSGLALYCTRAVRRGELVATPEVLRRSRQTVVLEVGLADGEGRACGLATLSFSVVPSRGGVQRVDAHAFEAPRTDFARAGSGLRVPFAERLGVRVLSAADGALEAPLSAWCENSLGALQGGAVAVLVDRAAEVAARAAGAPPDAVTADLTIHFLSLGRVGPVATRARVVRRREAGTLLRVELRDRGAGDRLLAVATASAAALA